MNPSSPVVNNESTDPQEAEGVNVSEEEDVDAENESAAEDPVPGN